MLHRPNHFQGFSLVELAIVLVILGLLVGGVLAGKSLIQSAQTRGQIAQIEKYRVAAHTFREKYLYLPGDLPNYIASGLDFTNVGGNGDGFINGYNCCATAGEAQRGEPTGFWTQLSAPNVGLIEGAFTGNPNAIPATAAAIPLFYPAAVTPQNFIYVWSCHPTHGVCAGTFNHITIGNIGSISAGWNMQQGDPIGMPVERAWHIDTKLDDGMPRSGAVTVMRLAGGAVWSVGTTGNPNPFVTCSAPAVAGSGGPQLYETRYNGANANCTLTFRL